MVPKPFTVLEVPVFDGAAVPVVRKELEELLGCDQLLYRGGQVAVVECKYPEHEACVTKVRPPKRILVYEVLESAA